MKKHMIEMEEKALLIFEDTKNLKQLKKSLMEANYRVAVCEISMVKINDAINRISPDLLVFYYQKARLEIVDIVKHIQSTTPTPIAVFSDESEKELISNTVTSGASAFVVDGIESHRIHPIIEAAKARFNKCQVMKNKLNDANLKLDERRFIDRAKGILMSNKNISEDEAYKLLRSMAMENNTRMSEISKSLITASELLK